MHCDGKSTTTITTKQSTAVEANKVQPKKNDNNNKKTKQGRKTRPDIKTRDKTTTLNQAKGTIASSTTKPAF